MYFRNYRPRNTYLDKCLKTPVWEDLSRDKMENGQKHWFNLNESTFFTYWVITVKVIQLQKSLLDTWKFFTPFLKTWTANDKYSLINKDKWMETIQMHLYQKQNNFSQFFSAFFESALNFEHFLKKMTLIAYVFRNLPTTKDVLR